MGVTGPPGPVMDRDEVDRALARLGAEHKAVEDSLLALQSVPVPPAIRRAGSGLSGDEHHDHSGSMASQVSSGHEAVATVVAGPTEHKHRADRPPAEVLGQRMNCSGDRCSRLLHQALTWNAKGLSPPVRAGHRLGRDGRPGGRRGPAVAEAPKVELEKLGVVGRPLLHRVDVEPGGPELEDGSLAVLLQVGEGGRDEDPGRHGGRLRRGGVRVIRGLRAGAPSPTRG